MFVVMASGICELHIYFTFLQEFYPPHIRNNLKFFSSNMCHDVQQFKLSIISKLLAKHKGTKVSFKITIRKSHVYIDIRWPWILTQYFNSAIWNDDRSKIIVLPSFQFATLLNSQNRNETEFIIDHSQMNLYMNIVISNWHNWSFDKKKMKFLLYFCSFRDYRPPITCNSLVQTNWGQMERCEKIAFQILKKRKKKMSWNLLTKCVTGLLLTVRSSSMKECTCHYWVST